MQIIIDRKCFVRDIQERFNEIYPFLKIEFYKKALAISNDFQKKSKLNGTEQVAKFAKFADTILLDINESKTVFQIEHEWSKILDLNVQVFRSSGNMWIETSLTRDWTLERQNREGASFSISDKLE